MFGISIGEILVIILVAFLVLDTKQIPAVTHKIGKTIRYTKKSLQDLLTHFNKV